MALRNSLLRQFSVVLIVAGLAACASSPPVRLYQLRAQPAAAGAAPSTNPGAPAVGLAVGLVTLPEYLDRAAIVQRQGTAGLNAFEGHRWAEPLADAVPRVLRQALAARLGTDQVWTLPAPAGVRITRTLRVEVQRLDADDDGRAVVLVARWTVLDAVAGSGTAPLVRLTELRADTSAPEPDAIAAAHSVAIDRLAEVIAAGLRVR